MQSRVDAMKAKREGIFGKFKDAHCPWACELLNPVTMKIQCTMGLRDRPRNECSTKIKVGKRKGYVVIKSIEPAKEYGYTWGRPLGTLREGNLTPPNPEKHGKIGKTYPGDTVVIDFIGRIDGEPFEGGEAKGHNLKLGSNTFIPGFEDALIGSLKGKTIQVKVTFPKDYQAKNLAGKDAIFETKVNEIKEDVEVKIDDEFAKTLGMNDLEALKKAISEQISKQHDQASRQKAKRQILDKLADTLSFDLPETLEKEEYENICKAMNPNSKPDTNENKETDTKPDKGMTKEEKLDASEMAKRRVRLGLLLSEIGRKNNIKVEEEDTRNAMMKEIQKYPGQEKQIMEYLKSNPEAQQQLSGPIFEDKIIDFILELANVKDKTVSIEELYKEDDMDLKKEASKAKKSNKNIDKNKIKKTNKKTKNKA